MNLRERIMDYSHGNDLRLYWRLFRLRDRLRGRILPDILTFFSTAWPTSGAAT